jgi:hypothetical protein
MVLPSSAWKIAFAHVLEIIKKARRASIGNLLMLPSNGRNGVLPEDAGFNPLSGSAIFMNHVSRKTAVWLSLGVILVAWTGAFGQKWDYAPGISEKNAIAAISADSLKGHLSFLASDLLQGRKDGSFGESVAGEYIAAQFRRAGLKAAGDDGYFQNYEPNATSASGEEVASGNRNGVLRNVIGVLPGSDPAMRETCILLSAHYDGLGQKAGESGWNAANDDGSGTAAVIEIASALASLEIRPRRSVVFAAFFGEEVGGKGASLYASKPAFPLEKTLANINLEQIGRTDSSEGDQTRRASLTGFDFSDLGEVFRLAGLANGVTVYKHELNSDRFFAASDNVTFANLGIPAHSLCVAFLFPDYHAAGDTWQKINFDNMAVTTRTIATALLALTQSEREPQWNEANPKAAKYRAAWIKLHMKN